MKVIIKEKPNIPFEDLGYGSVFFHQGFYCMKIYDNDIDKGVGLVLNADCDAYMETILIDYEEPIYEEFPNSQIIIE